MNKKALIVAVVIIMSGFLFYLVKPSLGQKDTGGSGSKAQQSQPAAGHQGHGGGGNATAPKSAVQEQPQAEVPTVEISTDSQKLLGVRTIDAVVKPAT